MPAVDILRCAVCGATLAQAATHPSVLFRGRRFHFCRDASRSCRMAFKREPERLSDANPDAGVLVRPVIPARERAPGPFVIRAKPAAATDDDKP